MTREEFILNEIALKKLALKDVNNFITYNNKTFKKPLHLKPVTDYLNRIYNGEIHKIAFSVPPQHFKSVTLLNFVAMYLTKYPNKVVAFASYAQRFSEKQVEIATNIYMKYNGENKQIRNRANEFTLSEGGGITTTSTNGALTGYSVDLLIIDDPIKDRADAESTTYRNKTWDWWNDVAKTRLRPNITSCIVLHTRWHKDDLIGRMRGNEEDFAFINIPAINENNEPLYHPIEYYEEIKKKNPYGFYSMYQGEPIGREHQIFKDVYFYNELPNKIRYAIGTDLAYTTKTKSDFSVAVVMAEADNMFYIVDVLRWQSDINETLVRLKNLQVKYNVPISIESNGVQKAVADMVRKYGIRIREMNPTQDKVTRSQEFSGAWNLGKVHLQEGATWLNDYLDEIYSFTGINDNHDDQIDASVYAFNQLSKSKGIVMKW